jgi:hypothetical protein
LLCTTSSRQVRQRDRVLVLMRMHRCRCRDVEGLGVAHRPDSQELCYSGQTCSDWCVRFLCDDFVMRGGHWGIGAWGYNKGGHLQAGSSLPRCFVRMGYADTSCACPPTCALPHRHMRGGCASAQCLVCSLRCRRILCDLNLICVSVLFKVIDLG